MFRRFQQRTPDSKRYKTSNGSSNNNNNKGRDPPTVQASFSSASSTQNESEGTPTLHATTTTTSSSNSSMRSTLRSKHSRSVEHRSTVSASHTNTTDEDRMRLRSILRGAMATPVAGPDETDKKAILKRVLARSQHLDRKVPQQPPPPPTLPEAPPQINKPSTAHVPPRVLTKEHLREPPPALLQHTSEQEEIVSRHGGQIETNPSALDFRNRLRKLTAQRHNEENCRLPNNATTFLDEKTREMIQQRFRQRQNAPAPTVTNHEEKTEDDADLEGYDAFFETLKNEVHGQHSLVSCWIPELILLTNTLFLNQVFLPALGFLCRSH